MAVPIGNEEYRQSPAGRKGWTIERIHPHLFLESGRSGTHARATGEWFHGRTPKKHGSFSPEIKEWIAKQQVTALGFYSAYPETSVREVWKALKTKKAFDALLDAAN